MKYTDTYFKIPVRMYEGSDFTSLTPGAPIRATIAAKALIHTDITGWQEMSFREVDQFDKDGNLIVQEFPCTLVNTSTHDFLCHWPRKKFEEELNKYAEKYDKMMVEHTEKIVTEAFKAEEKDLEL